MTEDEYGELYTKTHRDVTRFAASILRRAGIPNASTEAEAICNDVFLECLPLAMKGIVKPALIKFRARRRAQDKMRSIARYQQFISRFISAA